MGEWALKKHKNYKKEFGDKYPKNRKAFIPFILWLSINNSLNLFSDKMM